MSRVSKAFESDFGGDGTSFGISRLSRLRSARRIILALSVTALLLLTYIRNYQAPYGVENSILRYLSLTSEEQARLHNHKLAALKDGLVKCAKIQQRPVLVTDTTRSNPRAVKNAPPILIRNATLIDGDGSVLSGSSILLADGVVKGVGSELDAPEGAKIIDAGGRYITPGLVDMVWIRKTNQLT